MKEIRISLNDIDCKWFDDEVLWAAKAKGFPTKGFTKLTPDMDRIKTFYEDRDYSKDEIVIRWEEYE